MTEITEGPAATSVIEAYAAGLRPDMLDLSSPSPPPLPLTAPPLRALDLAFPTPGGSPVLRAAVAARYRTVAADEVLVTTGGSEALAALAAALGGPGRSIAVTAGSYPSFTAIAELAGTTLVSLDRMRGATAALVTNPTVPDGRRIDVAGFIASARSAGAAPIVDEVYRHIALDGEAPVAAVDLDDRAVSVGDLSKPLGLGGLRIGWIATHDAALRDRVARWLRLLTGGPATPSEALAVEALATFDARVAVHAARARANAPLVYAALRAAGWTAEPAQLGLTALAHPPQPLDAAARDTIAAAGAFIVGSEAFGRAGGFRIGLLTPVEELRTILAAIALPIARPRSRGDAARAARGLAVLMRVPQPGEGKSRLAAAIGREATDRLAEAFVEDTLATATGGDWCTLAACTPPTALLDATRRWPAIEVVAQPRGDLGSRILAALRQTLARSERAVLIGSDTPDLPPAFLQRAFAALDDDHTLVLGPATDGGFYLIGARAIHPDLFAGVEWSTDTVCARVIANARRLGLRVTLLDAWDDVDDLAALQALAARIAATDRAPATATALHAIGLTHERVRT